MPIYALTGNLVSDANNKVMGYPHIYFTFSSIKDARRYAVSQKKEKSYGLVEIKKNGMYVKGMIWWTDYPKNGKTASAWGYHTDDGLWFINKDGSLGRAMPYNTWRLLDGRQHWYTTTHKNRRK